MVLILFTKKLSTKSPNLYATLGKSWIKDSSNIGWLGDSRVWAIQCVMLATPCIMSAVLSMHCVDWIICYISPTMYCVKPCGKPSIYELCTSLTTPCIMRVSLHFMHHEINHCSKQFLKITLTSLFQTETIIVSASSYILILSCSKEQTTQE